jgi:hypothetical protein
MSGGIARQHCRQLSTACHTEPQSVPWTQQDLERGSALMTPASPPRCSIEAPIRPLREARVGDAAAGSSFRICSSVPRWQTLFIGVPPWTQAISIDFASRWFNEARLRHSRLTALNSLLKSPTSLDR